MSKPRLRWSAGRWRLVKYGQRMDGSRWEMIDRSYVVKPCRLCGQEWIAHISAEICRHCHPRYSAAQRRATAHVNRAVFLGELPALRGQIRCVDCGSPARHYDHRDYSRPLDVQPTCRSCNRKRGISVFAAA